MPESDFEQSMSDNINKLTNQDANEGADGETILLHEVQALLLLDYSHDAAWVSWEDSLVRNYLK